jgi:hypothetical protein
MEWEAAIRSLELVWWSVTCGGLMIQRFDITGLLVFGRSTGWRRSGRLFRWHTLFAGICFSALICHSFSMAFISLSIYAALELSPLGTSSLASYNITSLDW